MKFFLKIGITLANIVLCQLLFASSEILADQNTTLIQIQELVSQAESLYYAGAYDSGFVVAKIALEEIKQVYGESHPLCAKVFNLIGKYYSTYGKNQNYIEAIRYFEKYFAFTRMYPVSDTTRFLWALRDLGAIYYRLCRYTEAESCLTRALNISENSPSPEYDFIVYCLNVLGIIYRFQLRYEEAESMHKRALEICVKKIGADNNRVADVTNQLANLYNEQGRHAEAESLYKQGLKIRKKVFGPDHPVLSESLNNLGNVYRTQGKYAEAETAYLQALRIREKDSDYGPEHPFLAYPLLNLAVLYSDQGNYVKADSFCNRALKIVKKVYGNDHLHVASSIGILGDLCRWQGKYREAESLYTQELVINKRLLGSDHPVVASSYNKLALLYGAKGNYSKSLANYKILLQSKLDFIENVFSYASESQKMRYVNLYSPIEHPLLSLALMDSSKESKSLTLEMILKGKAVVVDALSAEKEITYCLNDDKATQTEKQHENVCSEIATMALASINNSSPKEYQDSLQVLYNVKDSLEIRLSSMCSEFRDELAARRFTVADVVNAIPEGNVLWEFVRYEPYDFKKIGSDKERTGPPRYLAFTFDHKGNITLTDLGDAGEIDSLVSLARNQIYQAREEVYSPLIVESERRLNEVTGKLYDLVFAPLESHLSNNTDIFISPDGQLSLLPFEILPCPDGKYVIEKFKISYLSSGRDLLKFKRKLESNNWALVMADPDFDHSEVKLAQIGGLILKKPNLSPYIPEPLRGAGGCLNNRFNSLPYTREETKSIVKTLQDDVNLKTQVYYEGDASEEALKGMMTAPRVLHLATHGYFCEDIDLNKNKMLENPLLRSGLALAGANRLMDENQKSDSPTEDGILTAFEASGLNLIGTELVTLSACETGVGEVKNGEGVYGLRRAFQHAGARTIVMSLWKIPDKETCELMNNFYSNWLSGQSKKESLRQSTLKVMNFCRAKYGSAHPLLWGGFMMVGDPD